MNRPRSEEFPVEQAAEAEIQELLALLEKAAEEVGAVVVGQRETVEQLFICVMCGGHALLEGLPGLGKTLLVKTLGNVCGLHFSRIQFTPDLMPADITGTLVLFGEEGERERVEFQPGPIFAQLVLADEINRATPKTQSALLEAMQERTVTVGGAARPLPRPFFVLATQNPLEMEGTYPLPEAQIDRFFFKVHIPYPSDEVLYTIIDQTTGTAEVESRQILQPVDLERLSALTRSVPIATHVKEAAVRLVASMQPNRPGAPAEVNRFVRYGPSPRGLQALVLAAKAHALLRGRYNVSFADLAAVASPALSHRLQINFQGEAEGISAQQVLRQALAAALGRDAPSGSSNPA